LRDIVAPALAGCRAEAGSRETVPLDRRTPSPGNHAYVSPLLS